MPALTISEPARGLVRIPATPEEVAEMLVQAGYPLDAKRVLKAQAKRDRKANRTALQALGLSRESVATEVARYERAVLDHPDWQGYRANLNRPDGAYLERDTGGRWTLEFQS